MATQTHHWPHTCRRAARGGVRYTRSPGPHDLNQARDAIAEAKKAGSLPPDKLAELEKRHMQARGVFYACQEAEPSQLAQGIIADTKARPQPVVAALPPPPANHPPQARIKAPAEGEVNAALGFSGEGSNDPDGDKLTYT